MQAIKIIELVKQYKNITMLSFLASMVHIQMEPSKHFQEADQILLAH